MMKDVIIGILNMTAWRMDAPQLFGGFHIFASLIAAAIAFAAARFLARSISGHANPDRRLARTLSVTGWILVILEVWKQLFLFFIVNNGAYDWWFFPFQLCSVPMYLCILLPAVRKKARRVFLTFMCGYTFVSAAATLIYPADILRSYTALTLHGFIWHGMLLFISLLTAFCGAADSSPRGLAKAAGLFSLLCVIAVIINAASEPLMQSHPGLPHSWAAMFYLNPYHISPQPVVDAVQKTAGIAAGLLLYVIVIIAVSSVTCVLLQNAASPVSRRGANR